MFTPKMPVFATTHLAFMTQKFHKGVWTSWSNTQQDAHIRSGHFYMVWLLGSNEFVWGKIFFQGCWTKSWLFLLLTGFFSYIKLLTIYEVTVAKQAYSVSNSFSAWFRIRTSLLISHTSRDSKWRQQQYKILCVLVSR